MRLVLDVENTTQTREGKLHLDPFEPENSLTMVGLADADSDDAPTIYTYDHAEKEYPDSPIMLQETLD